MDEFLIPYANFKRLYEEYKKYGSLSIGVDFDNTVHDYHKKGYKYEKVTTLLRRAQMLGGFTVHMFTANPNHDLVTSHMAELGINIEGINTNGVDLGYECRKPFYSLLLDDRAGLISAVDDLEMLVTQLEMENYDDSETY